jgi:hypothetical protein
MKKSELRQIIKEEISKVLKEEEVNLNEGFGDPEYWNTYFPKRAYDHYNQVRLDIGNQGVHHEDLTKLRMEALRAITIMLRKIEERYELA